MRRSRLGRCTGWRAATWATVAAVLLRVTSVTAAIGLASRFSAAIVGVVLVAVNAVFGVLGITAAWPFACYPLFSHVAEVETRRIAFTVESAGGAYWTVWTRVDPRARGVTAVRVYADTLTTVPERSAENPIRHELIDTLTP